MAALEPDCTEDSARQTVSGHHSNPFPLRAATSALENLDDLLMLVTQEEKRAVDKSIAEIKECGVFKKMCEREIKKVDLNILLDAAYRSGTGEQIAEARISLGDLRMKDCAEHYGQVKYNSNDSVLNARARLGSITTERTYNHYDTEEFTRILEIAKQEKNATLEVLTLYEASLHLDGIRRVPFTTQHSSYPELVILKSRASTPSILAKALFLCGEFQSNETILLNRSQSERIGLFDHYEEALKLAQNTGDLGLQMNILSRVLSLSGRYVDFTERVTLLYDKALGHATTLDLELGAYAFTAFCKADRTTTEWRARENQNPGPFFISNSIDPLILIGFADTRYGAWENHYWQALNLGKQRYNLQIQAQAHIGLGDAGIEGNIGHYQQALRIAREIKELKLQALALIGLATQGVNSPDHCKEALQLSLQLEDRPLQEYARFVHKQLSF